MGLHFFRFPGSIPENLSFDIKSVHEEVANMISHAIGWFLVLIFSPILLYFAYLNSKEYSLLGVGVFCFSLLMVYTSSTLYHSAYKLSLRRNLRIFDHISIYFLIAGSYTPYILIYLRTERGFTILAVLWGMAFVGSIFKLFFTHKFKVLSTIAYMAMGWMAIFIYKPLALNIPLDSMLWIKISGAFYSVGTIFYLWRSLLHNHFIWHLFVLGGSISSFVSVLYLVK